MITILVFARKEFEDQIFKIFFEIFLDPLISLLCDILKSVYVLALFFEKERWKPNLVQWKLEQSEKKSLLSELDYKVLCGALRGRVLSAARELRLLTYLIKLCHNSWPRKGLREVLLFSIGTSSARRIFWILIQVSAELHFLYIIALWSRLYSPYEVKLSKEMLNSFSHSD